MKQGSSQQSLTHLKFRCGILLGLLGSSTSEGGRREGEALAENSSFLAKTDAQGRCVRSLSGISPDANSSPQSEITNDQYRILSISHVKFREITPTLTDFINMFYFTIP